MIAFAAFIVVSDLPNARTSIKERIFQSMDGGWNGRWNPPQHHLDDGAVIVIDALVEEELSFRHPRAMVLLAIWCQGTYSRDCSLLQPFLTTSWRGADRLDAASLIAGFWEPRPPMPTSNPTLAQRDSPVRLPHDQ